MADSQEMAASDGDGRFNLADELSASREDTYTINNEIEPASLSEHLDALIDGLSLSPSAIDGDDTFDTIRSFMRGFASLTGPQRGKLLDAVVSAYSLQIDAATRDLETEGIERYKEHKDTLEKYAFSLQWLVRSAEAAANSREEKAAAASAAGASTTAGQNSRNKSAATTGWDWQRAIPTVLSAMTKSLRLSTSILFPLSAARDAFVSGCALKPVLLLQENETHLKVPLIKMSIFKVICNCVKNHGQAFAVQTSIMQALAYYEHLAEPMAELLALLRTEFDYERLGDEVLREVAARDFGGLDTKTPRCFARFLVRMAELSPRSVLRVISLLNKHLDSDSYPMRNAMLEVLGILIKDLTMTDDALPSSESQDQDDADEAGDTEEGGQHNSSDARKKQIEQFWGLITERFLDTTSWVRCKCITVCSKLLELPAKFPAQRTLLTQLSIQSLSDKSANARKNAVALLTKLILTHPYGAMHGGDLDRDEWTKRLQLVDEQLKEYDGVLDVPNEAEGEDEEATPMPEAKEEKDTEEAGEETAAMDESQDGDETQRPGAEDEASGRDKPASRQATPRKSLDLDAIAANLSPADAEKVVKLRLTRRYHADALAFLDQMSSAVPMLSQLLVSTSKAEVLESMEFFRVAHEYKLPGANIGVRKMIHLIWTKDNNTLVMEDGKELKGIKNRLIEVYRALYFDPLPSLGMADNVNRIARNLVERTFGATLAELTSLEEMLSIMCGEGMIDERVIEKLWSVYSSSKAIPRGQRRGAIIILSMLAVARKEIVADRIDTLLGIGLGPLGAKDVVLAKYTCIAMARVGGSVKKVKGALTDNQVRFPMSHPMFARLRAAIQWPSQSGQWFSLAEHAIQTIYLLGEQPDALCTDIVKQMTMKVFGPGGPSGPRGSGETDSHASVPSTPSTVYDDAGEEVTGPKTPAFALAQLLFVVGHVALKQIVYLEVVEREFKRRKAESDKNKVLGSKDTNAAAATAGSEASTSKGAGKKGKGRKKKDATPAPEEADELDQVAGNAEDEIGDVVGEVRENELLSGQYSLLSHFGPVIVHVCSNPTMYPDEFLRRAAVLSLCKFMCVSSHFCEAHLPLVLSILSSSKDPVVRSNVVIALGDMAISFGNLVDENSEKLYAGLNDEDLGVKKHTLMVLTHLILNGMIKVKGQLGVMARCLEDEDERLSDLAKLFFSELATKENAIYNQISDIISTATNAYDEALFQRILRFIFTFIDKDKQAESIVPKLCERFSNTTDHRQWRDIAFCLSLLPYKSDRSIKLLLQGLPWDNEALREPTVFKCLEEIVTKAKTSRTIGAGGAAAAAATAATSTSGSSLPELEAELDKLRAHGLADAEFETATQAKLAKARKRRGGAAALSLGTSGGRSSASAAAARPSSSSLQSAPAPAAARPERATRTTRRTRRAVINDDDDYE